MTQERQPELDGELTALLALEKMLLDAEDCIRLTAYRLSGSDPLRDLLDDMLRELEEIVAKTRAAKRALVGTGV